ncbi:DNA-binding response regulator [Arcobacter sp. CECT 8986]|uniref:response regulator transcription factor n=1 Tax=Arcobacter sp. CECT 8986 TaxID=2044507 RepID=UPI001009AF9B|nr:response regulator transcription factor [Arcobacter sp. CECT 8986]RXJ98610.1 DNA-binding response regulator [Arcobacter sp. CECT 8986]
MKILVLEDNERLCNLISSALEKEGYKVDTFYDGEDALEALVNGYQCFILDINVPSLDGISILESIRMYHKDIPVIIISSNHELDKIQTSYEIGCDDFLKKPFFMYELIHKIKKLCKYETKVLNLGNDFVFDYTKHCLTKDGEEVKLAKKEILFLELLAKDVHRVFSFDEIEEYVWEGEPTSLGNIRALVKRIRKKIPEKSIKIVKGLGYSIDAAEIE